MLALEEGKEKSMTLAFFFFPLPCFFYQKEHVVKCLCHRHWPFLLVEKGAAVLWWPGGWEEIAARGCCPHGFTKQAAPAGKPMGLGLLTICPVTWSSGSLLSGTFLFLSSSLLSFPLVPLNQKLHEKFIRGFPLQLERAVFCICIGLDVTDMYV